MSQEDQFNFLKKYENDYKKAEEKVQDVNSLLDIAIKKNKIEAEIQKNHPEFVGLVRKRIDLDGKKWNLRKEIEKLQTELLELEIKNPDNISSIEEIKVKIGKLEEEISDIETEDMLVEVNLDPIDEKRSNDLLVEQVLEEKAKNAFKNKDIQN